MRLGPQFIGGRIEINNDATSKIVVCSTNSDEKKYLLQDIQSNIIDAWWEDGNIRIETEQGKSKIIIVPLPDNKIEDKKTEFAFRGGDVISRELGDEIRK